MFGRDGYTVLNEGADFQSEDQRRLAYEIIDLLSKEKMTCLEAGQFLDLVQREIAHIRFIAPLKQS